jgi:hypothetical protein
MEIPAEEQKDKFRQIEGRPVLKGRKVRKGAKAKENGCLEQQNANTE